MGGGALLSLPHGAQAAAGKELHFSNVSDYRAAGDGNRLDTAAINRAITACHQAGDGLVYVPPGTYRVVTVVLQSNVTLYLVMSNDASAAEKFVEAGAQVPKHALKQSGNLGAA